MQLKYLLKANPCPRAGVHIGCQYVLKEALNGDSKVSVLERPGPFMETSGVCSSMSSLLVS